MCYAKHTKKNKKKNIHKQKTYEKEKEYEQIHLILFNTRLI